MASESCSTSSSSSGDDFVPIFLLRKVMKSLGRSYDKKRSTIRWMKQTQLQLKLSPVKTKAMIQTWTCVRLLLQSETHSGVSAESASRGIEDRTASVVLLMSSAWRKFTQRRTTARRSTTVAVDLPLFARIFLQLLVLDRVERLLDMTNRPVSVSPHQQSVEIFCFSALALLCPVDGSFIHHSSPGLTGNHIHLNGETGPCSTLYVKGSTKSPN